MVDEVKERVVIRIDAKFKVRQLVVSCVAMVLGEKHDPKKETYRG